MEIKELQERVDAWIREYGVRYFSELTNMACLTEEVGELARVMARKYGDQSFKACWCAWPTRRAWTSRRPSRPISPKRPPATRSVTAATPSYKTPPTAAKPRPEAVKTPRTTAKAAAWGISRLWHHGGSASRFGQFQRHGAGNYLSLRFVAGKA